MTVDEFALVAAAIPASEHDRLTGAVEADYPELAGMSLGDVLSVAVERRLAGPWLTGAADTLANVSSRAASELDVPGDLAARVVGVAAVAMALGQRADETLPVMAVDHLARLALQGATTP